MQREDVTSAWCITW